MLAKNKSGWCLLEYLPIKEEEIESYNNVTGAFAIICIQGKYLIGYNRYRKQWEFPAGGIESGETPRQAAERELWEETHQRNNELEFWKHDQYTRRYNDVNLSLGGWKEVYGENPYIVSGQLNPQDECELRFKEYDDLINKYHTRHYLMYY